MLAELQARTGVRIRASPDGRELHVFGARADAERARAALHERVVPSLELALAEIAGRGGAFQTPEEVANFLLANEARTLVAVEKATGARVVIPPRPKNKTVLCVRACVRACMRLRVWDVVTAYLCAPAGSCLVRPMRWRAPTLPSRPH